MLSFSRCNWCNITFSSQARLFSVFWDTFFKCNFFIYKFSVFWDIPYFSFIIVVNYVFIIESSRLFLFVVSGVVVVVTETYHGEVAVLLSSRKVHQFTTTCPQTKSSFSCPWTTKVLKNFQELCILQRVCYYDSMVNKFSYCHCE